MFDSRLLAVPNGRDRRHTQMADPRAQPDGRGDPTERTGGRGDGVIPGPHGLTVVLLAPALGESCCHSGRIGCGVQRVIGRAGG